MDRCHPGRGEGALRCVGAAPSCLAPPQSDRCTLAACPGSVSNPPTLTPRAGHVRPGSRSPGATSQSAFGPPVHHPRPGPNPPPSLQPRCPHAGLPEASALVGARLALPTWPVWSYARRVLTLVRCSLIGVLFTVSSAGRPLEETHAHLDASPI